MFTVHKKAKIYFLTFKKKFDYLANVWRRLTEDEFSLDEILEDETSCSIVVGNASGFHVTSEKMQVIVLKLKIS